VGWTQWAVSRSVHEASTRLAAILIRPGTLRESSRNRREIPRPVLFIRVPPRFVRKSLGYDLLQTDSTPGINRSEHPFAAPNLAVSSFVRAFRMASKGGSVGAFTSSTCRLLLGSLGLATFGACGGTGPTQSSPLSSTPVSATGTWVGTSPDGLVFTGSNSCSADVTLNLTQTGTSITGSASIQNRRGACVAQNVESRDLATNALRQSPLTGMISGASLSLTLVSPAFLNGVPVTVSALFVSGTISGTRLSMTGNYLPSRSWRDLNGNLQVDCDLQNIAANGECDQQLQSSLPAAVTVTR
jgi:hypothetical protein